MRIQNLHEDKTRFKHSICHHQNIIIITSVGSSLAKYKFEYNFNKSLHFSGKNEVEQPTKQTYQFFIKSIILWYLIINSHYNTSFTISSYMCRIRRWPSNKLWSYKIHPIWTKFGKIKIWKITLIAIYSKREPLFDYKSKIK